jgi:hypothetical protein
METSNYELGYADFGTRAEWPHPAVIGRGTYFAQQAKYHSRGDYFENAIMLIGSGSSTNCTLSASPGFCPTPTAWPTVEFDQIENEVTREIDGIVKIHSHQSYNPAVRFGRFARASRLHKQEQDETLYI